MNDQKPKSGVARSTAPELDNNPFAEQIHSAHQIACENEQYTYIDPETGLQVLTAFYLLHRGYCCTNRCRHCPYEIHELDKNSKKG